MAVAHHRARLGNQTELVSSTCTEPKTNEDALLKRGHTIKQGTRLAASVFTFVWAIWNRPLGVQIRYARIGKKGTQQASAPHPLHADSKCGNPTSILYTSDGSWDARPRP